MSEVDDLEAAKAHCLEVCGPISEKLANASAAERAQLMADEAEAHQEHGAALEAAYKAFQSRSGDNSPSNPAEGETPLEAHVIVESEAGS